MDFELITPYALHGMCLRREPPCIEVLTSSSWYLQASPVIQRLAREFPRGSLFELDGVLCDVSGYGEDDTIILQPCYVLADCVRLQADEVRACLSGQE